MDAYIVPAYEPDETLKKLAREMTERNIFGIIVDDGSGPAYQPIFSEISESLVVLHHPENLGKGRAIKTALSFLLREAPGVRAIVVMDADGQHLLQDADRLLEHVQREPAVMVLGVRTFDKNTPLPSYLGNRITSAIFALIAHRYLSDTQTGLRAFSGSMIQRLLEVPGERYEYEMNVLYTCVDKKIPVKELPITTIYHDKENSCSHFHKLWDSLCIYSQLFKYALSSFSSFLLDYALFALFVALSSGFSQGVLFSNIAARILSASYNFLLNRSFVFRETQNGKRQALQYLLLAVFTLCLNSALLFFFTDILLWNPMLSKILTECLLFLMNFLVQRLWIFEKHTPAHAGI